MMKLNFKFPTIRNEPFSGALAQRTLAQWSPEKVKNLKMSHERPTLGPPVPPNLTDGSKLFTELSSTTGLITTLKESPF